MRNRGLALIREDFDHCGIGVGKQREGQGSSPGQQAPGNEGDESAIGVELQPTLRRTLYVTGSEGDAYVS